MSLVTVFEELYRSFVFLSSTARGERAQVPALAGLRINFAGIEPVLAGFEFANHDHCSLHRALGISRKGVQMMCRKQSPREGSPWATRVQEKVNARKARRPGHVLAEDRHVRCPHGEPCR